jgi:hypothetical protein
MQLEEGFRDVKTGLYFNRCDTQNQEVGSAIDILIISKTWFVWRRIRS